MSKHGSKWHGRNDENNIMLFSPPPLPRDILWKTIASLRVFSLLSATNYDMGHIWYLFVTRCLLFEWCIARFASKNIGQWRNRTMRSKYINYSTYQSRTQHGGSMWSRPPSKREEVPLQWCLVKHEHTIEECCGLPFTSVYKPNHDCYSLIYLCMCDHLKRNNLFTLTFYSFCGSTLILKLQMTKTHELNCRVNETTPNPTQ